MHNCIGYAVLMYTIEGTVCYKGKVQIDSMYNSYYYILIHTAINQFTVLLLSRFFGLLGFINNNLQNLIRKIQKRLKKKPIVTQSDYGCGGFMKSSDQLPNFRCSHLKQLLSNFMPYLLCLFESCYMHLQGCSRTSSLIGLYQVSSLSGKDHQIRYPLDL